MGQVSAADTSIEPNTRSWAVHAILALLTPLAAIVVALALAGVLAPWGLLLPLTLAVFNILRLVKEVSLTGPTARRITLVVLNGALAALSAIGLAIS